MLLHMDKIYINISLSDDHKMGESLNYEALKI